MKKKNSIWPKRFSFQEFTPFVFLLISVVLVIFVSIKASITSFTHDESYTYLRYVGQSFIQIVSYDTPFTNNHILNTLLMKYFEVLSGTSELALRAPNIISLIVYLFFTYLIIRNIKAYMSLVIFILMTFSPYLLDFFGLARGYGISIGLMIFSLYFLLHFFDSKKQRDLVLFNLGSFFAVLANFALLDYWIAAILAYNFTALMEFRFSNKRVNVKDFLLKYNKINAIFLVLGSIVIYEPLRKIMSLDIIDFGGKTGFVRNTIGSLIIKIFYKIPVSPSTWLILKIAVLCIVGFSFVIILRNIYTRNGDFFRDYKPLIIINFTLILIAIITILQHVLLQTDYLTGRFALFLFPLFVLNIGFLLEYFIRRGHTIIPISFGIMLTLSSIFSFSMNINRTSYLDWEYDSSTKEAVKELIKDYEKNKPGAEIRVGVHWLFEPGINFYREAWDISWLQEVDREGIYEDDEYCYLFEEDTKKEIQSNYEIVFSSDISKTVLIRKERLNKKPDE